MSSESLDCLGAILDEIKTGRSNGNCFYAPGIKPDELRDLIYLPDDLGSIDDEIIVAKIALRQVADSRGEASVHDRRT
jgi:hypothetical protein